MEDETMPALELKSVSKSYGAADARTDVLKDVSLTVKEGEFVAIVGFSGSGKTTLINLMAGLIMPDSGEVVFRGKPVTEPGPERGVVFQSYSLLPWLSVSANVALEDIFFHLFSQVSLIYDQDMIQTLATHTPDKSFTDGIGFWGTDRGSEDFNLGGSAIKLAAEFLIIIPNEETRSFVKRSGFTELLSNPAIRRRAGDAEVNDAP
jgi:ABC-type sugar transport system ATPase subunit